MGTKEQFLREFSDFLRKWNCTIFIDLALFEDGCVASIFLDEKIKINLGELEYIDADIISDELESEIEKEEG